MQMDFSQPLPYVYVYIHSNSHCPAVIWKKCLSLFVINSSPEAITLTLLQLLWPISECLERHVHSKITFTYNKPTNIAIEKKMNHFEISFHKYENL